MDEDVARVVNLRKRLMPDPEKLPVMKRARVYAGGFGGTVGWIKSGYADALEKEVLLLQETLEDALKLIHEGAVALEQEGFALLSSELHRIYEAGHEVLQR